MPDQIHDLLAAWPADHVSVAVVRDGAVVADHGPTDRPFPLASVTKLITAAAVLVAVEEGTVGLDDPAGPEGSTVRHLLAHASGLGPEGGRLAAPGRRRIYSNAGFEMLGDHLTRAAGMPFAQYAHEAVIAPLGLGDTTLAGSPAHGAASTTADLARLAAEFLAPTLVAEATMATATRVAFPGLGGVLPGFGRQDPNDWGLGFEVRGGKSPHWTGATNSPRTFGHFGRSGTFLWVDPDARAPTTRSPVAEDEEEVRAGVACVCLTDRPFGPWAAEAWPVLSDAVVAAHGRESGAD